MNRYFILAFAALIFFPATSQSQFAEIHGHVDFDSSWARKVYLSRIPDFNQMFTASNALIIAQTDIDSKGDFEINFPADPSEKLYRVHFIKKGDPVSTLIIGSKDANHVFFIADNHDRLLYRQENTNDDIIQQSNITGNRATAELNSLLKIVHSDSLARDTIKARLIDIARTSSSELVGLLAVHNTFGLNGEQKAQLRQIVKRFNPENPYGNRIFENYASAGNAVLMWAVFIVIFLIALIVGLRIFKARYRSKIHQSLSQREIKVARLILDGKTNKEIATELNIELSTVKTHLNNIYAKLKINGRKQLHKYKNILGETD